MSQKSPIAKGKIILLLISLVFCFLASISVGSVYIPFGELIDTLLGTSDNIAWQQIIWGYRLPKALSALFAGSALAISGLLIQTLFRNPLAGPYVLGISSGASLGVALLVMAGSMIGFGATQISNAWAPALAASIGAFLVLLLVVLIAGRVKDSATLLIIGLMFGSATGAIVSLLSYISEAKDLQAYVIWTLGSLGAISYPQLLIIIIAFLIGISLAFSQVKALNAMHLGENYSQSLGISIKQFRLIVILATSILAGTITAFCGPIAFIGIAVPHLTRLFIPTSDHRLSILLCGIVGASLLLGCDVISQLPGSDYTLPINAVTSLFGAPVVIWLILNKKTSRAQV